MDVYADGKSVSIKDTLCNEVALKNDSSTGVQGAARASGAKSHSAPQHYGNGAYIVLPRTGKRVRHVPMKSGAIDQYLVANKLKVEQVCHPSRLVHELSPLGNAAEVLYIFRPLIYAILVHKWGHKSWKPWLTGCLSELIAQKMLKVSIEDSVPGGIWGLTEIERNELDSRRTESMLWLIRQPLFDIHLKPILSAIERATADKPLLQILTGAVSEYDHIYSKYYFASSPA